MTVTQRITATPEHPKPGEKLTICYEFPPGDSGSITLTLTWKPDTIPAGSESVKPGDSCVTVTVPNGATEVVISGSGSDDLRVVMGPG